MSTGDCMSSSAQLPSLSNDTSNIEDEKRKNYIRETDSEYIKLAKQGGIKDLLAIQTAEERQGDAVEYPKADWFGHHSMESSDQQKILAERKWQAPDYMVHVMKPKEVPEAPVSTNDSDEPEAPKQASPRALTAREERLLIQAKYNNREVPYQSDNLSCWERKDEKPRRLRK